MYVEACCRAAYKAGQAQGQLTCAFHAQHDKIGQDTAAKEARLAAKAIHLKRQEERVRADKKALKVKSDELKRRMAEFKALTRELERH